MWSVYDTLILITGLLTAAIAAIPVEAIEKKTRIIAVAVGAGLVLLSFVLGSLQSFQYPGLVVIAPVIPLIAAGAIVKHAKDVEKFRATVGEAEASSSTGETEGVAASNAAAALQQETGGASDSREQSWAALFDPAIGPDRLAEIAAQHPEFAPQIAAHPQCYPDLRDWARSASSDESRPVSDAGGVA
ncbi:hypothetical protein IT882_02315 [Microbacterium schleiferi]|uniref:Leucine rich repeat variant domain-containing protein n=1 Tax=Microbacterium schleiferi TaxID=69362 RepID=A0A7S8MXF4_9MICO|nr:hypothetical protein [Microbacterium schleiferi]QPE04977.1 hypothetical protein IT882_02315 [Microbacterium schleiferi]